jgi:predicted acylesterase/phospholipase RssA
MSARSPLLPLLALVSLAAACAAVHRPPATAVSLQADGVAARVSHRATIDRVLDGLARRAVARGDRTLDLLLLSGGGQHGAYGAGFLRGWRSLEDAPMPRFDLVTGVSTGALQAPFALLGTEAALDTLVALYRNAAEQFAPTLDWFFWLRRTGGVLNVSRYERTIETAYDQRLVDLLREEFRAGRQLAVGTTDLDLGVGRVWDLTHELAPTPDAVARFQRVLVASSAIPSLFPPVVLDGHVHTDGGVVANLLSPLDLADYRLLAERVRALGVSEPVTVRVWVVMNVWTHPRLAVIDPASRGAISQRSNGLMFLTHQPQLLARLAELARAVSADVAGLRMEMRYTAPPSDLANEPGASALFDEAWMRRLEQLGVARARGASPWDEIHSPYARPPALPAAASDRPTSPYEGPGVAVEVRQIAGAAQATVSVTFLTGGWELRSDGSRVTDGVGVAYLTFIGPGPDEMVTQALGQKEWTWRSEDRFARAEVWVKIVRRGQAAREPDYRLAARYP